ncbi:MAG: alpha/beta fold hydrolase [Candidatus Rokubacteria bacterium]|nr:alpha/beta fold hydrolase [Candidatus Rokubacteria bacterium]
MTSEEFVLVHGAAHGAWCWEAVTERLSAKGHRVVTLDLPGHGRRASEYGRASVVNYARAVVDAMALEGISRGIVVGHSMGGLVIPKVAELAPERVAQLVFLAAVALPDGGSLLETHLAPPLRALIRGMAQASGNGTFRYPAEMAWARWMNDLPRHHPTVQAALTRLTPQPLRPFVEPVDLKRFYAMSVPRTYIRCLKDVAVPPDRALGYAQRLGVKPRDLDAAHDVMLSAPELLVRILESLSPPGRGSG